MADVAFFKKICIYGRRVLSFKKIFKKKIYLWQESVVIVPKHQKLHFIPKSANSPTDGG